MPSREALAADIAEILKAKVCTSGQASKLRGRFTWAASAMFGKCARGGVGPLVQRQYHDASAQISPQLAEALCYLRAMAMHVAPPQIDLKATRSNVHRCKLGAEGHGSLQIAHRAWLQLCKRAYYRPFRNVKHRLRPLRPSRSSGPHLSLLQT